jgi:hypothetical protein
LPEWLETIRDGFRLLVGLRWADGPHRPVAFSIRFCEAWCSVPYRLANIGIKELVRLKVIQPAGKSGRVPLFLPAHVEEPESPKEHREGPTDVDHHERLSADEAAVKAIMDEFDAVELPPREGPQP